MIFLPPTSVEPSVFLIFYRLSRAAHQPQALPVGCFQVPMMSVPLSLLFLGGPVSAVSYRCAGSVCVHCTTAELLRRMSCEWHPTLSL